MPGFNDNERTAQKIAGTFSDPRVKHFYDPFPAHLVGKAFAKGRISRGPAWDIYFFYKKGQEWNDAPPDPAEWMHQLAYGRRLRAAPDSGAVRGWADRHDPGDRDPIYGKDVSEANNPLEANFKDNFISFNKGCYIGQEVVARLDTYDKVQRSLVGLSFLDDASPEPGTDLFYEDKKVGVITSVIQSPRYGAIALAYVRKAQIDERTEVTARDDFGEATAVVKQLPFSD